MSTRCAVINVIGHYIHNRMIGNAAVNGRAELNQKKVNKHLIK